MRTTIYKRTRPSLSVKVTINVALPHVQSLASGLLLRNMYRAIEDDAHKPLWQRRLDFNTNFLRELLLDAGELVCAFCGLGGLIIDSPLRGSLATADHFIPTSKGGGMFDKSNLVCACFRCNNKKADKIGFYDEHGKASY